MPPTRPKNEATQATLPQGLLQTTFPSDKTSCKMRKAMNGDGPHSHSQHSTATAATPNIHSQQHMSFLISTKDKIRMSLLIDRS